MLIPDRSMLLVLLLVFKLQNLFPLPAGNERWRAPVVAGLLFALHPLQTESVVYIYQRSTLQFKPFARLETSRNPETGGTGLGLSIALDIARGHGGDISLERSPLGGLRARLRLPV